MYYFTKNQISLGRGFSLVEAAIVLGVVGLVIGGIWTAAAAAQSRVIRNDTIRRVSLALSTLQNDFRHVEPVSSGNIVLHNYLMAKGVINYPYLIPTMQWRGLETPDGGALFIRYYASGGWPSEVNGSFSISFGSADGRIQPEDCYAYLSQFKGYITVVNGHGDVISGDDVRNGVRQNGYDPYYLICDRHLNGALTLIFPR